MSISTKEPSDLIQARSILFTFTFPGKPFVSELIDTFIEELIEPGSNTALLTNNIFSIPANKVIKPSEIDVWLSRRLNANLEHIKNYIKKYKKLPELSIEDFFKNILNKNIDKKISIEQLAEYQTEFLSILNKIDIDDFDKNLYLTLMFKLFEDKYPEILAPNAMPVKVFDESGRKKTVRSDCDYSLIAKDLEVLANKMKTRYVGLRRYVFLNSASLLIFQKLKNTLNKKLLISLIEINLNTILKESNPFHRRFTLDRVSLNREIKTILKPSLSCYDLKGIKKLLHPDVISVLETDLEKLFLANLNIDNTDLDYFEHTKPEDYALSDEGEYFAAMCNRDFFENILNSSLSNLSF